MEEEKLNLYQKLAKIRGIAEVVRKNATGFNYKYVSIDEILAKVTSGMKKYHVSLIPEIVLSSASVEQKSWNNTRFDKNGREYTETNREYVATAMMLFTWVNDDNPNETIPVNWFLTGAQKDPAQAVGSGLTYALRQFLCQYFQIAQPESDPDEYRRKQKEAADEENRMITREIISTIDKTLTEFCEKNPDRKKEAEKLVKQYVKSGNYWLIKESALAGKLLQDIQKTLLAKLESADKTQTN